jgi:hypothetical protein
MNKIIINNINEFISILNSEINMYHISYGDKFILNKDDLKKREFQSIIAMINNKNLYYLNEQNIS